VTPLYEASGLAPGARLAGEESRTYVLRDRLATGGQGEVWRLEQEDLLCKVCFDGPEAVRRRLRDLQGAPLADLPVVGPSELLAAPASGYVMPLVRDSMPLAALLDPPRESGRLAEWWAATGGSRRRLHLLARLAGILATLHSRGFVYGDLSPANVFVSASVQHGAAWLVDPDNIRPISRAAVNPAWTPAYAAPEVARGVSAHTPAADAYSLALVAFHVLTLIHPYRGALVQSGDPAVVEPQLQRGELPWIDDPEDRRNATTLGLPRDAVLSRRLIRLFGAMFGSGRDRPGERPTARDLGMALEWAAYDTVRCAGCAATYQSRQPACTNCAAPRPAGLRAMLWLLERPDGELMPASAPQPVLSLAPGDSRHIDEAVLLGERPSWQERPLVDCSFDGAVLRLGRCDGWPLELHEVGQPTSRPVSDRYELPCPRGSTPAAGLLFEVPGGWRRLDFELAASP